MANKTVTVRPSGGDYTSLAAAITGEVSANPNLTAAGMNGILTISIEGTWSSADTTAVVVNGFTTDSTHYVNIVADSSNRAGTSRDAGKYRLECSAVALTFVNSYTRVTGLQIKGNSDNGSVYFRASSPDVTNCVLDSCLVYDGGSVSILLATYAANNVIVNTIVMGSYWESIKSQSTRTNYIYNTMTFGRYGIYVYGSDTLVCKNCYSNGTSAAAYVIDSSGTFTMTTCASDDGSQSTDTVAYSTSTFSSVTTGSENFALVSGSGLIGEGTDLSSDATYPFNWDITGATRTTWDVGAYYYASATGIKIPVVIQHLRNQGNL